LRVSLVDSGIANADILDITLVSGSIIAQVRLRSKDALQSAVKAVSRGQAVSFVGKMRYVASEYSILSSSLDPQAANCASLCGEAQTCSMGMCHCNSGLVAVAGSPFECRCPSGFTNVSSPLISSSQCVVDTCVDYPCSAFSSPACKLMGPPFVNSEAGRQCGRCNAGYISVGRIEGEFCFPNIAYFQNCTCKADGDWVQTVCNSTASLLCPPGTIGTRSRFCSSDGWRSESDECQGLCFGV
jgi:hypothetical protein